MRLLLVAVLLLGCGQTREDRTVQWSGDGRAVGFQHGGDGVYVAEGGKLEKIFQPGESVLASSTPLFAPGGKRIIFTTARGRGGDDNRLLSNLLPFQQDPAGNLFDKRPVTYTCWLREPGKKPVALFEAKCDDVGYVAANLAVRWHPSGEGVLHVREVNEGSHELHLFDLTKKTTRKLFPHAADALIFDWSPDGTRLACVTGSLKKSSTTGVWIGDPKKDDWWHVSTELTMGELPSMLEHLRATRPAWTRDGKRFAFAVGNIDRQPEPAFTVRLGDVAARTTKIMAEGKALFRDLHWSPDGSRLGVVQGDALHVMRPGGKLGPALNRRPVRRFAGWNATGKLVAYTVPDRVPHSDGPLWSFLLVPEAGARDAVHVTDGSEGGTGREVFSGMRVTFPLWSPTEDKLSLWFTFSPTHRSAVSKFLRWGLQPGDPAAIFDPKTGEIDWMTVNAFEKAQVGHYHLLKRNYEEAWRWYEQAEREALRGTVTSTTALLGFTRPDDFSFFQYICLSKLGRKEEALAKLARFKQGFRRREDGGGLWDGLLGDALKPDSFLVLLLRDLYMAEVFFSLDAARDAEAFFYAALKEARTKPARLAASMVLSQVVLLQGQRQIYANIATETVAPLLFELTGDGIDFADGLLTLIGTAELLPLMTREFQKSLGADYVNARLPRWMALRKKARTDDQRELIDALVEVATGKSERARTTSTVETMRNVLTRGICDSAALVHEPRVPIGASHSLLDGHGPPPGGS